MSLTLLPCVSEAQSPEAASSKRPNVIVFIADDVSWNDYGCYGSSCARTPNIDRLAANGIRFDQAFLTASSCSPSRSSIITGRYPHNNGKAAELHLPISGHLPWFPERLRASGYYTALSGKNHMKRTPAIQGEPAHPVSFDLIDSGRQPGNSGGHANWVNVVRNRHVDKPFFMWLASFDAHRNWDADQQWRDQYGPMHRPEDMIVPPFLVDSPATRKDLASYANEVTRFDHHIGLVVEELRKQDQLENTLIFVLADNGRPFPRAKTRLHDSGMKTALIAHWPAKITRPSPSNSLVSVIDLAPTILTAAGVEVPPTMQGVSLLGVLEDPATTVRNYAFSEHNWHDYEAHGRSVRDGKFLYVKNNRPQYSWQGPADSVRSPSHLELQSRRETGKMTPAQADVFQAPRPSEELYVVEDDPNQLNNLVEDPAFQSDLNRLRKTLADWSRETGDSIPNQLSADSFHRVSGQRLRDLSSYRGTTPGEDVGADMIHASGPR